MEEKTIGRYIVTNPDVCHGEPVFRGTRILVADVLEQVASGMAWEAIYLVDDSTGYTKYAATTSDGSGTKGNTLPLGQYSVSVVPGSYDVSVVLAGYAFGPGSVANPVTAAGAVTDNFTALPQLAQPTTQCIKNLCQGGLNDGQACTTVADCPAFPL